MKISAVAYESPAAKVKKGGGQDIKRRVMASLALGHDVRVYSFVKQIEEPEQALEWNNQIRRNSVVGSFAYSVLRQLPLPVASRFVRNVASKIISDNPDLIVFEGIQTAGMIDLLPKTLRNSVVIRVANWESDYHFGMARASGGLRKLLHVVTGWQYKNLEIRLLKQNLHFAHISYDEMKDAVLLGERLGSQSVHSLCPPIAVPLTTTPPSIKEYSGVLLFGDWSVPGNSFGATWFIKNVLPRLKLAFPDLEIHIVGLGSDMFTNDAINCHGYLSDLSGFIEQHSLLTVLPVSFGGGVKIKTIDILASGLPVVLSEKALEGLVPDDSLLVNSYPTFDAEAAFEACRQVISNPRATKQVIDSGRQYVEKYYATAAFDDWLRNTAAALRRTP